MKKIILSILVFVCILVAQNYATLNIYSVKKANDKSESVSFQLLLDKVKITNISNGERVSIKILNPKNMSLKIRNRKTAFTYNTDFNFKYGNTYFWEFSIYTKYTVKDRPAAIEDMKNEELFDSDSIKYIVLDVQADKIVIQEIKNISVSDIDFGKENKKEDAIVEIPERPQPVGAGDIDAFVNKAFDIYETTKAFSDQIRNINATIEKLMSIETIVGNPVKKVKREAMMMERNVKIIIKDSQDLIKIAPNVLKGATKLKFTKIATATKNVKSAIGAVKWSLVETGELINDLPEILVSIGNFEKQNNITDTEVVLDDFVENSKAASGLSVISVSESELQSLTPEFGQIVFTKDTKKLLFFDGTNFKKIILEDL